MLWDSHEGWVVLDVVQLPEEDFSLVGKMFPLRAGRSHFSLSNFQMQDAGDEMSAYVRLSVCFSMCVSLLDQRLYPLHCNVSNWKEMHFLQDGRINHGRVASLVYQRKDSQAALLFSLCQTLWSLQVCKSAKRVRGSAVSDLCNWKKLHKANVAWSFLLANSVR